MAIHEDDRAAYLAGEERQALTAHERAELDDLRSALGSAAVWAQPSADLEDRVVTAVAEQAAARPARSRERRLPLRHHLRWRWSRPAYVLGGLAAAATVAAIAVGLAPSNSSPPPRHFAMVVSGTALAPAARGSATLTKTASGWRIELAATGSLLHSNGKPFLNPGLVGRRACVRLPQDPRKSAR